jgi:hypothetical protein
VVAVADVAAASLSQASHGQAPQPGVVWQEASHQQVSVPLSSLSVQMASVAEAALQPVFPQLHGSLAHTEPEHSWCQSPIVKLMRGGPVLHESRSPYTFGAKLGEGVYGDVYEGFRSGRTVAIKFIKACDDARMDAAAEAYVLDRCRGHPNIVQLVDVFRGCGPNMIVPSFALVFQHGGLALTGIIRRKIMKCQDVLATFMAYMFNCTCPTFKIPGPKISSARAYRSSHVSNFQPPGPKSQFPGPNFQWKVR